MRVTGNFYALLVVLTASILVNAYYVSSPRRSWDETINVKASLHDVNEFSSQRGYTYSIDHPALKRYIYRAALYSQGITSLAVPDVDYHQTQEWNLKHGRLPPFSVIIPMRVTNAFFMTGAVALVFLTAVSILGNWWLAALVVAPLVLSERLATGAVVYLGCDSFLGFLLALSLYLAVILGGRGKGSGLLGVLVLGVVGGLATSAKLNGALVVIAVMIYLAVCNRGTDRFVRPFLAGVVAVVVFVALNPVMRGGGLSWAQTVIDDMLTKRRTIWIGQYGEASFSRVQLVAIFFPYAAFVYAALAAVVLLRRKKWLPPLVIWSGTLVLGTLLTVNTTYDRYFLPVQMGAYAAGGILAWALVRQLRAGRGARGEASKGAIMGICGAAAVSVGTAVAIFALIAALAPWGPSRLRPRFGPARKAAVFFRQAAAFYGVAEPLGSREAALRVRGGDWQPPTGRPRIAKSLFTPLTRRRIGTVFFVAAMAVLFLLGRRVLGRGWLGAAFVMPFLWGDFSRGDFWMHSVSECFFLFFAALVLYAWVRMAETGGPDDWWKTVLLSAGAGAAAAAAPRGVVLVAGAAAFAFLRARGRARVLRAGLAVAAAAVCLVVLEPAFWYMGAGETLGFAQGMFGGAFSHWTARFGETTNILIPLRECFPYWPLLPLGGAALYLLRRERWALPLALYGALTLAGTLVGLDASAHRVGVGVKLALCVCAGLPALLLLSRQIRVEVSLEEPPEAAGAR